MGGEIIISVSGYGLLIIVLIIIQQNAHFPLRYRFLLEVVTISDVMIIRSAFTCKNCSRTVVHSAGKVVRGVRSLGDLKRYRFMRWVISYESKNKNSDLTRNQHGIFLLVG